MGEARQLDVHRGPIGTARQRDAKDLGRGDGVVTEGLVEVPHTEEEDRVGVLALDLLILLHQGRLSDFLGHSRTGLEGG